MTDFEELFLAIWNTRANYGVYFQLSHFKLLAAANTWLFFCLNFGLLSLHHSPPVLPHQGKPTEILKFGALIISQTKSREKSGFLNRYSLAIEALPWNPESLPTDT